MALKPQKSETYEFQYLPSNIEDIKDLYRVKWVTPSLVFIYNLREILDNEMQNILKIGLWGANFYYEELEYLLEINPEDICYIGTRARIINGSFQATWHRNRFVKSHNGSKSKVYSTHIPKGRGYKYSMKHFRTTRDPIWVQELVETTEEHYAPLRKLAEINSKMRSLLNQYEKIIASTLMEDEVIHLKKYKLLS